MSALLDVILPVFILIGFGWLAARMGKFSESHVDGLMKFAQSYALPCVLFRGVAQLDLWQATDGFHRYRLCRDVLELAAAWPADYRARLWP